MKYIIVIGDGMADNPVTELQGKTPLEQAAIPEMDAFAAGGQTGSVRTVPTTLVPGSDTAILSICGYDPRIYYSGRSPLEAAGSGVSLQGGDCSYRCNMVTLEDSAVPYKQKKILSHSGGSIEGEEALALMDALLSAPRFTDCAKANGMSFYPSPSFRHIALQRGVSIEGLKAIPPHDRLGEVIGPLLPSGCDAAQGLRDMMALSHELLNHHPVNEARRQAGKRPANGIWFWAEGTAVTLSGFTEKYHKTGFVVSAVPLVWGIGALAGLDVVKVAGATGELNTNFEAKTDALLQGLARGKDFGLLHVEAPDECTHNGDLSGKLQAIEWLDSRCLARLRQGLAGQDYRLLVLSDHKTLTATRGHDGDPVPYLLYDSRVSAGDGRPYTERECAKGRMIEEGHRLIDMLLECYW